MFPVGWTSFGLPSDENPQEGGWKKLVWRDGRTLKVAEYLCMDSGHQQPSTLGCTLCDSFAVFASGGRVRLVFFFFYVPLEQQKLYFVWLTSFHRIVYSTFFPPVAHCATSYAARAIGTTRVGDANHGPGDPLLRGPLEQADIVGPAYDVLRGNERHRIGDARHP